MPLHHPELPGDVHEVDVIVAGGGTAGCIIAARLSDADPNLSILVIEGGPDNHEVDVKDKPAGYTPGPEDYYAANNGNPLIKHPAMFFANILPASRFVTHHFSAPSKHLGERHMPFTIPTARVLGGGSSVNFALYSRGQRTDYDGWGVEGWSADELLPYMRKLETYHGPDPKKLHGTDGPIVISRGDTAGQGVEDDFMRAVSSLGYPEIDDLGDLDSCNGAQRAFRYMSPDGARQDTAHAYLHPRLHDGKHPNLHVVVESNVAKVLLEGNRATGVVYEKSGEARTVRARKMVIVSAGAFGSPAILERSGIGNPEVLKQAGVETIVEAPGVGNGYEDHHLFGWPYRSNLAEDQTHDFINRNIGGCIESFTDITKMAVVPDRVKHMIQGLSPEQQKLLAWNGADVTCKLRPREGDLAALGPEFQAAWEKEWKSNANKPMAIIAVYTGLPGPTPPGQYFAHNTFTPYPFSRGHVHITGPGLADPLNFDSGFYSDADGIDIKMCRWAYKTQREIARRRAVYRGEWEAEHPPFAADSAAACVQTEGPLSSVEDIVYTPEDDAVIDAFMRTKVMSTWHSMGTNKMGDVVDAKLSVKGTTGLKVADMSIVPGNVGAHTANTAMVIGEKAADILIKELGLA